MFTRPGITCSKLTIETLERGVKYVHGVFIVNFEHTSHLVLVFLFLTLNMNLPNIYDGALSKKS